MCLQQFNYNNLNRFITARIAIKNKLYKYVFQLESIALNTNLSL